MAKRTLPKITDCPDLAGQYVLLRASLNVPVKNGVVTNEFRIKRALPTINYLRQKGAKIIIIAHIGREVTETLRPVCEVLQKFVPVKWAGALLGEEVINLRNHLENGEVLMLENLRHDEREKTNSIDFATELAALSDLYVNDAFSDSHREHASLVAITKLLPAYFGFNFLHEYDELSLAMNPTSPSLFILGGAKFETKMPLIEKFLETYDQVFVGGALSNDIFKARGYEIGTSLVSEVDLHNDPIISHPHLIVPVDVVVKGPRGTRVCGAFEVDTDECILDAGPASIKQLAPLVKTAKTILWNGPLGDYEQGFANQTEALAKLIVAAGAYSIIGGGDTVAAIEKLEHQEKINFISTAGGAMLTYLETGTLPAIDVVLNK